MIINLNKKNKGIKNAIYTGTFDPITNGHIDIINRSRKIFSQLLLVINSNQQKKVMFDLEERKELAQIAVNQLECNNISVIASDQLTVSVAKQYNINVLIRGVRCAADFSTEWRLAHMNQQLSPDIETLFISSALPWAALSSSLVKEIACYGGDISPFVPPHVVAALVEKIKTAK